MPTPDVWYYADRGEQIGPLSLQELKDALATMPNPDDVLVWANHLREWKRACEVPELTALSIAPPPRGPIITLVSGEKLVVEQVLLYDINKVAEINSLTAQAHNELQGFTSGLGFWGSPGWVIGGALALRAVEGMISDAKHKNGLRLLQLAADKTNDLPRNAAYFPVNQICGLRVPNPQSWSATPRSSTQFVHYGGDFVAVRTHDGVITFRWSQVTSYIPPETQPPPLPVAGALSF